MNLEVLISRYTKAIENFSMYEEIRNIEEDYRLLLDIFYYEKFEKENSFNDATLLDIANIDEYKILEIIRNRVKNYSESQNVEFLDNNYLVFSGLLMYYAQQYNLYLFAIILLFLLKFNRTNFQLYKMHVDFILRQKKRDGNIGFINPLKNFKDFDEKLFYTINLYAYTAIKKYIEEKEI